MPAGYAPIPNPPSAPDADRELNEAFESESDSEEDTHESTPLTSTYHSNSTRGDIPPSNPTSNPIPGTYDFEREYDYDYPPPGSPPPPSSTALPNNYGNSNGRLPTSPVLVSIPTSRSQPSFFRRAVGAILPTHYVRVPTDGTGTSRRGGGSENDGVFANVMAKPTLSRVVQTEDGDVRLVPEDNQKEPPPTYADAQLDAVPPYWETTVHAPSGTDPSSSMIIDDLPTGSLLIFGVNLFISFFFQFVGFVLTYLLHTSHAAKFGSRAGLGLTLIQYGFYSRTMLVGGAGETGTGAETGIDTDVDGWTGGAESEDTSPVGSITSKEWLSFLLMTLGWFLLLSSIAGFWRVKRWERSIRSSSSPSEITPEAIERDIAIRRNLASVFGIGIGMGMGMGMGMGSNGGGDGDDGGEEEEERRMLDDEESRIRTDEHGNVIVIPAQELLEEARLERSLRNAGIL